jgi:hypothetical protein
MNAKAKGRGNERRGRRRLQEAWLLLLGSTKEVWVFRGRRGKPEIILLR